MRAPSRSVFVSVEPRVLIAGTLTLLGLLLPLASPAAVSLRTDTATFELDDQGSLAALRRTGPDRNLVAAGQPAPLLQIRIAGTWHRPERATWDAAASRLTLNFGTAQRSVTVSATAKGQHLAFEITGVQPSLAGLDLALWGPYPIAIGETIGEIVGVVRDRRDAVGLQALNAKTLGGSPANEHDIDTEFGADDTGHYPGYPDELRQGQGFRGDTARPMPFGSVLQAYTRQRDAERVIANWGHPQFRVLPHTDGGIVGSRIALFATDEPRALNTIGEIELAEGLPHPTLDGSWAKTARTATASYLIVDFSEATIDRAIEMTRRAGLRYLYHSSPFETWGHFQLKRTLFPGGWDGLRACVDKARKAGVDLGFHTLSNFITPNDPHVTPKPDPRLAVIGATALAADIAADAIEIPIADAALFVRKSTLNTVRLGDELVRFESVATNGAPRLLKCQRGAWGTTAAAHARGLSAARLLDHDYNVFFSDLSLSLEIARRIAEFCNHTGARQLSFDGLEGNWSTGHGTYARTLFTQAWHDALRPELRGRVINDASNPGHFNWHINTRMNWGEPWYAGFRESQTLYRFKNQLLFHRNFMPHMLGWFALRADTSLEDAEWLLARAAGFDAGFTLATSLASTAQLEADPDSADTARRFGATTAILAAIAHWESARMSGAFPENLKARLRDNRREFHLRPVADGQWDLHEVHLSRFAHAAADGAATGFEFRNPAPAQPLQWILRSDAKVPVPGLHVDVQGRTVVDLGDRELPAGGALKYSGGSEAVLTDATWKELARVPVDMARARVGSDPVQVQVGARLPAEGRLKVELRTLGAPERLKKP